MNYIDIIEDYTQGKLSTVEQLAFEDELKDNQVLHDTYQAWLLSHELILSQCRGRTSGGSGVYLNRKTLAITSAFILISLLVGVLIYWPYQRTTPTANKTYPLEMYIQPTPSMTTASDSPLIAMTDIPEEKYGIVSSKIISQNNTTELPATPKIRRQKTQIVAPTVPVNEELVNTELSKTISSGEQVTVEAENTITMKPGFKVEAGAVFYASVKKSGGGEE